MKRFILLFIIFSSILTGCTQYSQLEIGKIHFKSLDFKGTTAIEVTCSMDVNNPTKYTIAMQELVADLYKEGKVFAKFDLVDIPQVPPMTDGKTDITIEARVADPLAIITTGLDLENWSTEDFTINGKIVLTSNGKQKKVINLKNVPLDRILNYIK